MGLFDIFKKKKAKLTEEQLKWNKMWDLWAEEKAQSPYAQLMTYQSEINNGGHDQYFTNIDNIGNAKVDGSKIHLWTLIPKQGVAKYSAGETSIVESIVSDEAEILVVDNKVAVVGAEVETISIYTLMGTEVASAQGNEVATDNLVHGIYVVLAKTTDGKIVSEKVYID